MLVHKFLQKTYQTGSMAVKQVAKQPHNFFSTSIAYHKDHINHLKKIFNQSILEYNKNIAQGHNNYSNIWYSSTTLVQNFDLLNYVLLICNSIEDKTKKTNDFNLTEEIKQIEKLYQQLIRQFGDNPQTISQIITDNKRDQFAVLSSMRAMRIMHYCQTFPNLSIKVRQEMHTAGLQLDKFRANQVFNHSFNTDQYNRANKIPQTWYYFMNHIDILSTRLMQNIIDTRCNNHVALDIVNNLFDAYKHSISCINQCNESEVTALLSKEIKMAMGLTSEKIPLLIDNLGLDRKQEVAKSLSEINKDLITVNLSFINLFKNRVF